MESPEKGWGDWKPRVSGNPFELLDTAEQAV